MNRLRCRLPLLVAILASVVTAIFPVCRAQTKPPAKNPNIDIQFLINGRRPIWMGPEIRYTVYTTTIVEARIYSLGGELINIYAIGEKIPGQYAVPFDGTMPGDPNNVVFDGKYYFELFFGEDYAAKFWIICKPFASLES